MWVVPKAFPSSTNIAIKWHPIPPKAASSLSGNFTVEVLWGHPEQKYIDRDERDWAYTLLSISFRILILLLGDSIFNFCEYLLKRILIRLSAVSSPYPGMRLLLFSSNFPTITGLWGWLYISSLTNISMKDLFSSITRTSSSPLQNLSMITESTGKVAPSFKILIPALFK